jgi:Zn finger protein HypA/HybF involved in hydrogenase expression
MTARILIICDRCGHEYRADKGSTRSPCPRCQDKDDTTEFPLPPGWEDPDVVEE